MAGGGSARGRRAMRAVEATGDDSINSSVDGGISSDVTGQQVGLVLFIEELIMHWSLKCYHKIHGVIERFKV